MLYREFGEWLLAKNVATGALPKKAAAAAPFFRSIDLDTEVRQPLIAADLLRIFDSKTLRANLNASRFICERYGLQIDEKTRAEARDLALIDKRLRETRAKPWGDYLKRYREWLSDKPVRTVSQYLGVAQAFCQHTELSGSFSQAQLVSYLDKVPGARATVSVWVTFVRAEYGWQVTMPPKSPKRPVLKRSAAKLTDLLRNVVPPSNASDDDLSAILCVVYEFKASELRRQITGVTSEGDISTRDGLIRVQAEMKEIVFEWARRHLGSHKLGV